MGIELSVIVPIYNEERILWEMAEQLNVHLNYILDSNQWQFVLVDNGSSDSTSEIVKKIKKRWPTTLSIYLERPNIGNALAKGLERCEGKWAYIINADWWDGPFLKWAWENRETYQLIIGSGRADYNLYDRGGYRKLLSWGLNLLLRIMCGFVGTETHGQKLLYMPEMKSILGKCTMRRGQFDTEFTIRAYRKGLWIAEAPVPHIEIRKHRNLMLKKIMQNIIDIVRLWMKIKNVPRNSIRYHRWARKDIEELVSIKRNEKILLNN